MCLFRSTYRPTQELKPPSLLTLFQEKSQKNPDTMPFLPLKIIKTLKKSKIMTETRLTWTDLT